MRRRRKHKPQDVWQQRARSYYAELNRNMSQWENDNIVATLAICALRRLLDGTPLEPGDVEKAAHFAERPDFEIDRVRAIIERDALSSMLQRMRRAIVDDGRTPWQGPRSAEYEAAVDFYRDKMIGPWKQVFRGPLGDNAPLGTERELD